MYGAYDDEDNAPMNDEAFDRIDLGGHNPTVYGSWSEMKAAERWDLDGMQERTVPVPELVRSEE